MELDLATIRALIALMDQHGLAELEVEEGGSKVRLARPGSLSHSPSGYVPAPTVVAPVVPVAAVVAIDPNTGAAVSASNDKLCVFESPMVGTFYRSPSPGTEPFVAVGDAVNEDTVLCIIEAMKVMNEIKAEMPGVLREVLVENGAPVEFGQALFKIERSA